MSQLYFRHGDLCIDSELYETYFQKVQSVALLKKDNQFFILPIQQAGGGLLAKIRNSQGDRVVHAMEFFQRHNVDIDQDVMVDVSWCPALSGLSFPVNVLAV